jgi:two-component system, sensor histidine kinase YesM
MNSGKRQSLKIRFIKLTLALITIPFLLVAIVSYVEFLNKIKTLSRENGIERLQQLSLSLNQYIKEMDRLSVAPLYNSEIITILKKRSLSSDITDLNHLYGELLTIQTFLTSLQFDRNEIRSVRMYSLDGHVFSYADFFHQDVWETDAQGWMEQADSLRGRSILLPAIKYIYNTSDEKVLISYIRLLLEPFSFIPIGYMKIDLTVDNFLHTMFPDNRKKDSLIFIFNRNEQLIIPESLNNRVFISKNEFVVYENEPYYVASSTDPKTGFSIYELISYKEIRRSAQTLTRTTIIIAFFTLVIAYFLTIMFSNRLINPLAALTSQLHRISEGDYSVRAVVVGKDEVAELAMGFNLMAAEIQRLIHEVLHVTLKEQEAEILLLQNQMNPHFLNNTLETVNMMAVMHDDLDISDVVTSLSRMLRYSIAGGEKLISLEDELEFARNYINIQSHRLGELLQVDINVPEKFIEYKVPKFLIQPFIENTIEHGLESTGTCITITAELSEDYFAINIKDNGKGISPDKFKKLMDDLNICVAETEWGSQLGQIRKGIALRNIHHRIRLIYGPKYGLVPIDTKECGVWFQLRLPVGEEVINA